MPAGRLRVPLLFAALGLVWGVPYLMIKVAVAELEPSTLVLARTAVAAAVMLPIALLPPGDRSRFLHFILSAPLSAPRYIPLILL